MCAELIETHLEANEGEDAQGVFEVEEILLGVATSPSGMAVDSIVFYIQFNDDTKGFTNTKVSGFRRTGFTADDFE